MAKLNMARYRLSELLAQSVDPPRLRLSKVQLPPLRRCQHHSSSHLYPTTPISAYRRTIAPVALDFATNSPVLPATVSTPTLRRRNLCATGPSWIKTSRRCALRPRHRAATTDRQATRFMTRRTVVTMVRFDRVPRAHRARSSVASLHTRSNQADQCFTGASSIVCFRCTPALCCR
jgi:hypothetical protein